MNHDDVCSFSWYTGNLKWLKSQIISLGKSGSQSYGTALPSSDLDIRGVAVAPLHYYLGFVDSFEQLEVKEPIDCTIYDIRKFFKLAADANPNILEQLWVDPADVYKTTPEWEQVLDARTMFLSRRVRHTFSGYAISQLRRIRTHRRWLLDPPKAPPQRQAFGLPEGESTLGREQLGVVEARVKKLQDITGPADEEAVVNEAVSQLGLDINLIPLIVAERNFGSAVKTWSQYQTWKKERNPTRQALEAKFGYDTKHGMHLVRLLRMGAEILGGQGVIVKRFDADELLAIRAGNWSFEKLEDYALQMDERLGEMEAVSILPKFPDRVGLDKVLVKVISGL